MRPAETIRTAAGRHGRTPMAVLLLLLHLPIFLADACAPHPPGRQYREAAAEPPSARFLLGTDDLGRDITSRVLHGARVSLVVATLATAVALGLALGVGALSALGAVWRRLTALACDTALAVPWIVLLLAARGMLPLDLPPATALLVTALLLGAVSWGPSAQVVCGRVADTLAADFVGASRAAGASPGHLARRHVWPAVRTAVFAQAAVLFPQFILAEAALSFLGLGVHEPATSLGLLIGETRSLAVLAEQPWRLLPAVVLIGLLIGYNGMTGWMRVRTGSPT